MTSEELSVLLKKYEEMILSTHAEMASALTSGRNPGILEDCLIWLRQDRDRTIARIARCTPGGKA